MTQHMVVVGGGISGLSVAIHAAKAGRSVLLLERASHLGGRGASHTTEEHTLNIGPHALYPTSKRRLSELGVEVTGGIPNVGLTMRIGDRVHPLPATALQFMASGALSMGGKMQIFGRLKDVAVGDPARLDGVSVAEWIAPVTDTRARHLLEAVVRVSSYTNAPEHMSAGVALRQLRAGAVWYLDGGWQTIVDGLERRARELGVEIKTKAHVEAIASANGALTHVVADGDSIACDEVTVTASPKHTVALLGGAASEQLASFAARARATRAACLDVALRALPRPHPRLVLGIERPTYLSVHSKTAKLAPEGGAVIHVAHYLAPDEKVDPGALRRELERELDLAQPGWREQLIEANWAPAMTTMNAMPEASMGGTNGRPAVDASGVRGVYLAGDWVGPRGLLLDACVESALSVGESLRRTVRAAA
jgi:phytoene dehydrogenase-like protein